MSGRKRRLGVQDIDGFAPRPQSDKLSDLSTAPLAHGDRRKRLGRPTLHKSKVFVLACDVLEQHGPDPMPMGQFVPRLYAAADHCKPEVQDAGGIQAWAAQFSSLTLERNDSGNPVTISIEPCRFFLRGDCRNGSHCCFSHNALLLAHKRARCHSDGAASVGSCDGAGSSCGGSSGDSRERTRLVVTTLARSSASAAASAAATAAARLSGADACSSSDAALSGGDLRNRLKRPGGPAPHTAEVSALARKILEQDGSLSVTQFTQRLYNAADHCRTEVQNAGGMKAWAAKISFLHFDWVETGCATVSLNQPLAEGGVRSSGLSMPHDGRGGGSSNGPLKSPPSACSSAAGAAIMKLTLSNSQAGTVIGKGGAFIEALRETTGAQITISSDQNTDSTAATAAERILSITGSKFKVAHARQLVADKLNLSVQAEHGSRTVEPCRFFAANGHCRNGSKCHYSHEAALPTSAPAESGAGAYDAREDCGDVCIDPCYSTTRKSAAGGAGAALTVSVEGDMHHGEHACSRLPSVYHVLSLPT